MTYGRKILERNGYRAGVKAVLMRDTGQPRMADYNGIYAIDDPSDDDQGFCLVGDDMGKLIAEALDYFDGYLG